MLEGRQGRGALPDSPATRFGRDARGGRFHYDGGGGAPSLLDVLAVPGRPGWLAEPPCATEVFTDGCDVEPGRRGRRLLGWSAGPDGEVWVLGLRDWETVAVRMGGW